jgi:hypothetical protein
MNPFNDGREIEIESCINPQSAIRNPQSAIPPSNILSNFQSPRSRLTPSQKNHSFSGFSRL